MKLLLFILAGLICAGVFITRQQVQKNVQNAIENNTVVIGMTPAQAIESLGAPLSTKRTQSVFGTEEVLTFGDGNEMTFTKGRATKIETVKLSKELTDLKKALAGQKNGQAPGTAGSATSNLPKSQFGGTALDRRPYQKYNGTISYSNSDDPDKLGTATETNKRNGLYRGN